MIMRIVYRVGFSMVSMEILYRFKNGLIVSDGGDAIHQQG